MCGTASRCVMRTHRQPGGHTDVCVDHIRSVFQIDTVYHPVNLRAGFRDCPSVTQLCGLKLLSRLSSLIFITFSISAFPPFLFRASSLPSTSGSDFLPPLSPTHPRTKNTFTPLLPPPRTSGVRLSPPCVSSSNIRRWSCSPTLVVLPPSMTTILLLGHLDLHPGRMFVTYPLVPHHSGRHAL